VIEIPGKFGLVYTNPCGGVTLGIAVNEQGLALGHGKGSAKVDGSRGFANASLLIRYANNVTHDKTYTPAPACKVVQVLTKILKMLSTIKSVSFKVITPWPSEMGRPGFP
jgi:hypothetical protein